MAPGTSLSQRVERTQLGAQADRVVQLVLQRPQFSSYASAREVAERAGANVATVVRAAQQLGFAGWTELRAEVRDDYLNSLVGSRQNRTDSADAIALMLRQDAANLAAVSSSENIAAIREVADAIKKARRTVIVTSGSGIGPAHILAYLASIVGFDIRVTGGAATEQAVAVSQLESEDCLIALNVWRLTHVLRDLTRLGHSRGAAVVVLTDLRSSPLTADADHVVIAPIEGVAEGPSLTAMVAVVHALLAELEATSTSYSLRSAEQAWERLNLMDDQG